MIRSAATYLQANPIWGQLARFAVAGGISTVIYAAVYYPLITWVFRARADAVYAVPFAFAVAVTAGFFLHSRWSFKGHGMRTSGGAQPAKFVFVQAVGLAMNAAITWGWTVLLGWPAVTALVPVVTITPLATFALNRAWVFGGQAHG